MAIVSQILKISKNCFNLFDFDRQKMSTKFNYNVAFGVRSPK